MAIDTSTLELLKSEALRLLALNTQGLGQMLDAKGLITDADSSAEGSAEQTFTRQSMPERIKVLKAEIKKLESMTLVIAVVGTMKAGKSTTINAIVGREVLPSHNVPMTALPTLVRHKAGQIEPVLSFASYDSANALCTKVKTAQQSPNTPSVDPAIDKLWHQIQQGEQVFQAEYRGEKGIYQCLESLNHLVRLCRNSGVDFPFDEYQDISSFPVIDVEFAHLSGAETTQGHFALLDTPGPNEAGQHYFQQLFQEQLARASAILTVFNYDQLNSEADYQVRIAIKDIAEQFQGRLFALVNKFDANNQNSLDYPQTQKHVAETLMEGLLKPNQVFPVSASQAYLANRVRYEMQANRQLPDEPWVEDFAKGVFGFNWEEKLSDKQALQKGADWLWEQSGFAEPLEKVVMSTQAEGAFLTLESAVSKLLHCNRDIENFLGARRGALSENSEELQRRIAELKQDIELVDKLETTTKDYIYASLAVLKEHFSTQETGALKAATVKLEEYFREGKKVENKLRGEELAPKKKKSRSQRRRKKREQKNTHSEKKNPTEQQDFDPEKTTLPYETQEEAEELIKKIQQSTNTIVDNSFSVLQQEIKDRLKAFQDDFKKVISDSEEVIYELNEDFAKSGFQIELSLPDLETINRNNLQTGLLFDVIQQEEKINIHKVYQRSWWGSLKRKVDFFGGNWGYDYEIYEKKVYTVKLETLKKNVNKNIQLMFKGFSISVEAEVISPWEQQCTTFFDQLRLALSQVRGDFQQGLRNKQKSHEEQERLNQQLLRFQQERTDWAEDTEALADDMNKLDALEMALC